MKHMKHLLCIALSTTATPLLIGCQNADSSNTAAIALSARESPVATQTSTSVSGKQNWIVFKGEKNAKYQIPEGSWSSASSEMDAKTKQMIPPDFTGGKADMGFTMKRRNADDLNIERSLDESVEPLTNEDMIRYTEVALKMIEAINTEDRDTYRALFTDEAWNSAIPWYRDMFAEQTAIFGRISRAYKPRRGYIHFGKMAFRGQGDEEGATIIVHFEEPNGGALTFTLNSEGKIKQSSVYVKKEMTFFDPGEDQIIYDLEE